MDHFIVNMAIGLKMSRHMNSHNSNNFKRSVTQIAVLNEYAINDAVKVQ